jgi:hypothetical protein
MGFNIDYLNFFENGIIVLLRTEVLLFFFCYFSPKGICR